MSIFLVAKVKIEHAKMTFPQIKFRFFAGRSFLLQQKKQNLESQKFGILV